MVDSIALTVTDQDLAESLKDCEVGEEKTLTFKVTGVEPGKLSGDVTAIEGYGEQDEAESEANYDAEEELPRKANNEDMGAMKKKMPRAIIMIGAGK